MFALMVIGVLSAQAGDYAYLVFTNTEGETTAIPVSGMEMAIDGTNLRVTSVDGTVTFVLTELSSMQFSTDGTLSSLESVLRADKSVEIYTLTGAKVGVWSSLEAASSALSEGVYVVTDGKNSIKISSYESK